MRPAATTAPDDTPKQASDLPEQPERRDDDKAEALQHDDDGERPATQAVAGHPAATAVEPHLLFLSMVLAERDAARGLTGEAALRAAARRSEVLLRAHRNAHRVL